MADAAPVWLVGPEPPPVHGLSVMHGRMAQAIAQRAPVLRFDVGGPAGRADAWPAAARAIHLARLAARVRHALVRERPRSLLISTSAGGVMWFDAWCARLAARAGVPVHVHHHSWACLDDGGLPRHRRAAFAELARHRHWVLCGAMRDALAMRHGIAPQAIGVLPNAAFFPPAAGAPGSGAGAWHAAAEAAAPAFTRGAPLTLGFLSNIVASKGIFEFLDVVARLQQAGHAVAARVAGPVDADIAGRFAQRLQALADARHVGALHGDAAKAGFFAGVHRLLLPSRHVHEAEPLVVIEALANGVPVIATGRGCLPQAWAHAQAVRLFPAEGFVDAAAAVLEELLAQPRRQPGDVQAARDWHRVQHLAALPLLHAALDRITAGRGRGG